MGRNVWIAVAVGIIAVLIIFGAIVPYIEELIKNSVGVIIEVQDADGTWHEYTSTLGIFGPKMNLYAGGIRISSVRVTINVGATWDCPASSWNVDGSYMDVKIDGYKKKTETVSGSGTLSSSAREWNPQLGPYTYSVPTIEGWCSEGQHNIGFNVHLDFNLNTPDGIYTKSGTAAGSVSFEYDKPEGLLSLDVKVLAGTTAYGGGR